MMTAEEIRDIIADNKSDIAFVIGNGIHRYNNDDALSWDKLLIDLWSIASGEIKSITTADGEIIKGISYTEFYDVLEMKCKQVSKKQLEDQRISLSKLLKDSSMVEGLHKKIITDVPTRESYSIKELVDYTKKLSEIGDRVDMAKAWDRIERQSAIHGLQNYISNLLGRWEANEYQKRIANSLRVLNIPVLTTNYDNVLATSIGAKLNKIKERNFTHYYPWSSYYATNTLQHPLDGFGIWHINGMINYPTSIRLGLSQYMGSITRARKLIHQKSEELFVGKDIERWRGKDTWLHIIFNKSLFIFGLALEENETFLRWLLIQRANYFNKFPDRNHNGWYLTRKKDIDNAPGKRFFLESVGFKILEVEDFKIINEDIWA